MTHRSRHPRPPFLRCLLGALLILGLLGGRAMAVEEPHYTTTLQDGAFELRDYPAMVVAEVSVTGTQYGAASAGFRLLAHYIFGGNEGHQSLPMTAPVTQQSLRPSGTNPAQVLPMARDGGWIVRFIMPAGSTLDHLPQPNDAAVHLKAIPPTRYAVVRFSGWATPGSVRTQTLRLAAWIDGHHLHPAGAASLAQYNPPWTLWFMRRNEIMVPLESP
jgi:hypothetical protein